MYADAPPQDPSGLTTIPPAVGRGLGVIMGVGVGIGSGTKEDDAGNVAGHVPKAG